jgi:large repetitive protein
MRRSTMALILAGASFTVLSPGGVQAALTKPLPPLAYDDSFAVPEDTSATVSFPGVLGNDRTRASGDLTAVLITRTAHGTLSLRPNGSLSYTPDQDFSGIDVFSYAATDGAHVSEPAIVAISVVAVNDPPVAVNDAVTFSRIAPIKLAVTANDFDVDGEIIGGTIGIVSPPQNGRVTIGSNGVIVYTPMKGFSGTDAFTYVVWDDLGARSNPAIVRLQRR